MDLYRKNGIIVGVLYIIATVAGAISFTISGPILERPVDLVRILENQGGLRMAAIFMFIMGLTVAGTAIWAFPVLKKHSEALALAFVGGRLVEGALYVLGIVSLLSLVTLSQEFNQAGTADLMYFQNTATMLLADSDQTFMLGMSVFDIAALLFYYLLFQTRLVPRWLSIWGLVGIPLAMIATLLPASGVYHVESDAISLLNIPIAVQEMVMAVWLIVKGFDVSGLES